MGHYCLFWFHNFTSRCRYRLKWASGAVFVACARSIWDAVDILPMRMARRLCGRFFVAFLHFASLIFFQIIIIWYICSRKTYDMAKVIHVHLLHNIDGLKRKDWYFSSISAVYTVLTAEQVGATKNYLLHAGLAGNGTVCTKKAIIKQSQLISGGRRDDG